MKELLKEWKRFLGEGIDLSDNEKVAILKQAIQDFSITNPELGLRDLSDLGEMIDGQYRSPAAAHVSAQDVILIDIDAWNTVKFERLLEDILHEVTHSNQKARWEKMNPQQRAQFLQGKKVPKVKDLKNVTWRDLSSFWSKAYGYMDAPHEVEARQFAAKNLTKALKKYL